MKQKIISLTEKDLYQIIKESVNEVLRYPSIHDTLDNPHFYDFLNNRTYICEGLITSYPADTVMRHLKEKCYDVQVLNKTINNETFQSIVIFVPLKWSKSELSQLKGMMNKYGYHLSKNPEKIQTINGKKPCLFEPKFTKDISKELRQETQYLYHMTTGKALKKINQIGFIPRGNNETGIDGYNNERMINNPDLENNALYLYPQRIYALHKLEDEQMRILNNLDRMHVEDDEKYLLVLDLKKIPETVKFYNDPQANGGVFTYDNIPREAIVKVFDMELLKNLK